MATLYIVYFTDVLKPANIQLGYRKSPNTGGIIFYLNKTYPLTSIAVVLTEDAKTNKYPHELWHVVAESAPVSLATFNYGAAIPGMKPKIATALPETLQPGVDYSLIVEMGKGLKGEKVVTVH